MKIERLFQVLVVAGVSSTAGFGCGADKATGPAGDGGQGGESTTGGATGTGGSDSKGTGGATTGTGGSDSKGAGGATGSGGAKGAGGATGSGGSSSAGAAGSSGSAGAAGGTCKAVCHKSTYSAAWTDCNGCCCWLPLGSMTTRGSQICGDEPCCKVDGNGR
jgi:hypothetical protein